MNKTVVLCVGNRNGGDDAIGPFIRDQLLKHESSDLICIDAGIAPENFTGVVKKHNPDHLIIVDAIEMDLFPGEIRRVPPDMIGVMHVSTHGIPLSVLITYLKEYVECITLIGIQPEKMNGMLSETMKRSGEKVIQYILSDSFEKISTLS